MTDAPLARRMWQTLEPYHGLVYFVPEAEEEYTAIGLTPGRMGYFASRSAAMGAVGADVVIATFFNFEPGLVRRAIPAAWALATPADVWAARLRAVDRSLRRILGDRLDEPDIADAATLARRAAEACHPEGRPLYAGHAAMPWDDRPHVELWQAITLLREFRGDGHVAALALEGLTGCEALVVHGATGTVPPPLLQATRAWSDEAWAEAVERLRSRGWLDAGGELTDAGRAHRSWVEDQTDRAAAPPWAAIGDDACDRLRAVGRDLSRAIVAAGTFPHR